MTRLLPLLLALPLLGSCTVVSVSADSGPARIQSDGLIDGYVTAGMPADTRLLHVELFDGRSPGALAQFSIWKLLRFELGFAGAAIGVGPFDIGLGILGYDPRLPDYVGKEQPDEVEDADGIEIVIQAGAASDEDLDCAECAEHREP